jgi:hypothetical protein
MLASVLQLIASDLYNYPEQSYQPILCTNQKKIAKQQKSLKQIHYEALA